MHRWKQTSQYLQLLFNHEFSLISLNYRFPPANNQQPQHLVGSSFDHRLTKCLIPPEPSRTPVPQGSPVRVLHLTKRGPTLGQQVSVQMFQQQQQFLIQETNLSFVGSCFTRIILLIRLVLSKVNFLCFCHFTRKQIILWHQSLPANESLPKETTQDTPGHLCERKWTGRTRSCKGKSVGWWFHSSKKHSRIAG